jgi:rhomboid protease GluP
MQRPIATWVLLGIIGIVFVIETLMGGSTDTEVLVRMGAKVTPLIAAGEYWRLFTSMFLHIGFLHVMLNGYALVIIGTELERFLGWHRFLAIYLLSGLAGSLASYAFSPNLSAGASGAIFGIIGALAAFFVLHRNQLGSWGQRRLANIAFLIVLNIILGLTQPRIDNLAHVGGLVAGFGLGWALAPRYAVDPAQFRLIDRNRFARYWPALVLAVVILAAGTALANYMQRDSLQSYLLRVDQAVEREDWNEVVVQVDQALAQDSSLADVYLYFQLGLAHNYLGEPEQAAQAYEAALELEANDTAVRWNLALTYLALGRYAEARSQFETYQQLFPEGADEAQPYLDQLRTLTP